MAALEFVKFDMMANDLRTLAKWLTVSFITHSTVPPPNPSEWHHIIKLLKLAVLDDSCASIFIDMPE
ncbi:hypothetical protein OUZ56_022386 [Daphnia magna]|uniref:Uncharacterized protein n=1 Tax=Daphnia magna TaxID=35525 RepID=A0ABR0AW80_9CRUS|nr:hypothetical protein OUZ56_022386 [Daphnia magna]